MRHGEKKLNIGGYKKKVKGEKKTLELLYLSPGVKTTLNNALAEEPNKWFR
jgi:hypothetical protein